MWQYEKKLQFPINIKNVNPKYAQIIISQYGGPDGELGASMRYLTQRYSMPYDDVKGILTDIGIEVLNCLCYNTYEVIFMYMEEKELKRYYKRHFGKRNTLSAYELLDDEKTLITLLISAYNCYAIRHSKTDERYALSLITNPADLFFEDCEKQQFINEFKNYIIETVESKYYYKDDENNESHDNCTE